MWIIYNQHELPPRYNWNIVESGVKRHKTKQSIIQNVLMWMKSVFPYNVTELLWMPGEICWDTSTYTSKHTFILKKSIIFNTWWFGWLVNGV